MCDLHFNPVTPIVPKLPLREEDVVIVKQKSTGSGGGYRLRFVILLAILVLFICTSIKFNFFKLKRLIGM
jgi:hypothetical protein